MNDYIVTFFTHFDAVRAARSLRAGGCEAAALAPVPRRLSSSCGTCVKFRCDGDPLPFLEADFERLVRACGEDRYETVADNR